MSDNSNSSAGVGDQTRPSILAIAILFAAFALSLVTAWGPTMEHITDPTWAEHQQFHAFREIFLASVFGIAGIVLCLGPLRRGEAAALKMVGLLGFGVVGGFWIGLPITGIGKSGPEPFINHGLQLFTLVTGYLLAWLSMRKKAA